MIGCKSVLQVLTISAFVLVMPLLFFLSSSAASNSVTASFIDAGQGDSVLLQDGNGFDVLIILAPASQSFTDVPFSHWAWQWIESLFQAGLTSGYPDGTYRPENAVIRAEMAVFLKKGIHGASYFPPTPTGGHPFGDISGHWAEAWIEDLYKEGMTSGFPDGTYRPENQVTRAEISIFLMKGKYGSSFTPPTSGGGAFSDVAGHWAEDWIEQLKEEGITSGYPDGSYRPENPVNRAEMAVFMVNTFNLSLVGPPPTPTPTPLPTSTPVPPANVQITYIFYDGVVPSVESDEYAEITNQGASGVNLQSWRLNAGGSGQDFYFPRFVLNPGQSCRIYTNEFHPEYCGFNFERGSALWRNGGDCGYLYDDSGAPMSTYCY